MNIEELEKWVLTEDGNKWLDEKKSGLLTKRDELLAEIKKRDALLTEATEKGNAFSEKFARLAGKYATEYLTSTLCNGKIKKEAHGLVAELLQKEAEKHGGFIADVDDSGVFTYADADGKGFKSYFDDWAKTDIAQCFMQSDAPKPPVVISMTSNNTLPDFSNAKNMSTEEVARMFGGK